jgi:hypothetical protein
VAGSAGSTRSEGAGRPDWTAYITAVAVNTLDIDSALKIVSMVTGVHPSLSVGADVLLSHELGILAW